MYLHVVSFGKRTDKLIHLSEFGVGCDKAAFVVVSVLDNIYKCV